MNGLRTDASTTLRPWQCRLRHVPARRPGLSVQQPQSQGASPRRIYIGSCAGTHFAYRSLSVSSLGAKVSVAYFTHLLGLAASAVYLIDDGAGICSFPLPGWSERPSTAYGNPHVATSIWSWTSLPSFSSICNLRSPRNCVKGERKSGCPTYCLSHTLGASCGLLLPAEKWLLNSLEPAMGLYRRPNT